MTKWASDQIRPEVAFAGQRVKRKIFLALILSSVIPLLILAYASSGHIFALLDPVYQQREVPGIQVLLGFTALLMAGGGFVIWDVATAVTRAAQVVDTAERGEPTMVERGDEIGALMSSFSRMLSTVEQQGGEIDRLALRLDSAYQELDLTNTRLKEFSFKDEVTGLYNRRFFSIRLEEEVSRYRRFNHAVTVVLLDLDDFKVVNDELGHGAGDETLRALAEILLRHSRGINVICRFGGDEFAVLLVETSKAAARLYADRICHVLATYPFAHGRRVTASIGIASLPEDVAPAADDLIRAADEALYAAKRAGKNRVSVYEDTASAPSGQPRTRLD